MRGLFIVASTEISFPRHPVVVGKWVAAVVCEMVCRRTSEFVFNLLFRIIWFVNLLIVNCHINGVLGGPLFSRLGSPTGKLNLQRIFLRLGFSMLVVVSVARALRSGPTMGTMRICRNQYKRDELFICRLSSFGGEENLPRWKCQLNHCWHCFWSLSPLLPPSLPCQ